MKLTVLLITLALLAVIVFTSGCASEPEVQQTAQELCAPKLITTSPDGVSLWEISADCPTTESRYPVYFSTRGTQTEVHQYKSMTRPVEVPAQ